MEYILLGIIIICAGGYLVWNFESSIENVECSSCTGNCSSCNIIKNKNKGR
jgi:hypothetical protein